MLEVSEEIKDLYRNGTKSKSLILNFPALNLTITNDKIYYESSNITESISEGDELTFGDCNSAEFKITVADITEDLNNQQFTVTQVLNGDKNYSMPLGTYTVKSCKRQSDRRFKDIVAYDDMVKLDRDVVAWYNSRTFPVTLKALRESLLVYCGIAYETQDLPNDEVLINKTIRPSDMNGRDVMKRICELNGGFGHITRENKFKVITLAGLGLYPSETLYPSEDLFPAESGEIIDGSSSGASYYPESTYEDYICRAIDQLKIRTNEEDGGVTVNNGVAGTNEYIIQGNFLISDKTTEELTEIAEALFLVIKNKYYRPHNMITTGLPYLEVGDSILINTKDDVIESFIFSRTLTGIQALKDSLSATGYEYRQNKVGLDVQISQLEQTASQLQDTTEEMEVDLSNLTGRVDDVEIVAEKTAEGLTFKVTKGEVSNQLSVETDKVYIGGNRLVVESTNFQLDEYGNATFSGDVDGATIIAKWAIGFYDASTGNQLEVFRCDGNCLYIGIAVNRIYVEKYTHFEDSINVNGDVLADSLIVAAVDVDEIDAARITTDYINSDSHNHNLRNLNCTETSSGNFYLDSGSSNIASVDYVQSKVSSDERIKTDLDEIPAEMKEIFMKLVPRQFRYNNIAERDGICFGDTAQHIEFLLEEAGLNPEDYNIVGTREVNQFNGESKHVPSGKLHFINNENVLWLAVKYIQEQQQEINELRSELADLRTLLTEKGVI